MPRIKIGAQIRLAGAKRELAEKLAQELRAGRAYGQPTIYEQEYSSGNLRVTVVWDEWARMPLEDRTTVILKAYELAEGMDSHNRVALASGLTVPEAQAAGLLPFEIFP